MNNSMMITDSKWEGGETPTALRRMEDPLPECLVKRRMDPPKPRKKAIEGKTVLDEDEFVAQLEKIIEKDYFPDNLRLREQLELVRNLDASDELITKNLAHSVLRHRIFDEYKQMKDENSEEFDVNVSLTKFVAKFTSEDNESFHELLQKMQEEHRRAYWWALDDSPMPHLLLKNGEKIDEMKRIRMEEAASAKPRIDDDRPGAVETWKFNSRNPLMFQPTLTDSCRTCGISEGMMLQIESSTAASNQLALHSNSRVKASIKMPSEIQKNATRFVTEEIEGAYVPESNFTSPPLEIPNSNRSSVRALDYIEGRKLHSVVGYCDQMVPMTPVIEPGVAGESPMMTWGNIQGTPMILDGNMSNRAIFDILDQPKREVLAHKLDAKKRAVKKSSKNQTPLKASTTVGKSTPLTPAAFNLAKRLGKTVACSPFGGSLGIKTPSRLSTKTPSASTPQRTPLLPSKGSDDSNRPCIPSNSMTDGLLDF